MGLCCRGRSPFPCLQEKRENDVKKIFAFQTDKSESLQK